MKKIIPLLIALVLLVGFVVVFSINDRNAIAANRGRYIYNNTDTRNSCVEAMSDLANVDNTILMFGSSELSASDNVGYPPALFNMGNSDFNIVMIGRGTMQSLHHAITLGALSNSISSKKVVLIVSPQWFTASHLSDEAYASRFSEPLFSAMVKNKRISYSTKRRIADRAEGYLKNGNPEEYERVLLYDKVYIERPANPAEVLQVLLWDNLTSNKQEADFLGDVEKIEIKPEKEMIVAGEIDYNALLEKAEQAGVEACTNNDLYIYDEYYTKYVEPSYSQYQNSSVGSNYSVSPEYDDLDLFLTVCEETGIHPLIVNIPVNGIWYDWIGFSQNDRDTYYQKIRDICRAHSVSILDFSDREYEHYFLKDIMHLGWKGWVYLDEAVYRYYLDQGITEEYPFKLTAHTQISKGKTKISLDMHISDVGDAWLKIGNETYLLHENQEGFLETTVDIEIAGEVELFTSGSYGTGIHALVQTYTSTRLFDGNTQQLSLGATQREDSSYALITEVEDNRFNAVVFQIYDPEMQFVGNIFSTSNVGKVKGTYRNELSDGEYTFILKGNSNKADETITEKTYLKHGDSISINYNVVELQPTRIEIDDVEVWLISGEEGE